MSDRRPKRRCVTVKSQVPSAIHYVGYVEDAETPEMIMKKFEELERIQKAANERRQQQQGGQVADTPSAPPGDGAGDAAGPSGPSGPGGEPSISGTAAAAAGALAFDAPASASHEEANPNPNPNAVPGQPSSTPHHQHQAPHSGQLQPQNQPHQTHESHQHHPQLDEEALLEVFKQTSVFNVRSAMSNNELLMAGENHPMHDQGGAGGGGSGSYGEGYGTMYGMEDLLYGGAEQGSDLEDDDLQYLKGFWSDEDYEVGGARGREGSAGSGPGGGRRRRGTGGGAGGSSRSAGPRSDGGAPKPPRAPGAGGQSRHVLHQVVTQYNRDTNALIRRRIRVGSAAAAGGGGALVQLRVPPAPLPLSWGRTVRPYVPAEPLPPPEPLEPRPAVVAAAAGAGVVVVPGAASGVREGAAAEAGVAVAAVAEVASDPVVAAAAAAAAVAAAAAAASRGYEAADVTAFPFDQALGGKTYQAVMVNAGWQPGDAADAFERGEDGVMDRFRALPIPRLCPKGFVLVWAHKGLLQAVCRALTGWGYVYVENLTWAHLTPANAIATQPGRHFRRSHSTLLMFRREGEGRDIELRHQRNPDVVFDCVRCLPEGGGWDVPGEVLSSVETMLPAGKGAFLELWAQRGVRRPGWDHIAEVR